MAVEYTPGTSGSMAVANVIVPAPDTKLDNGVDYASGQSSAPLVKPVMSKMLGTVKGNVTSTVTGNTGH